jgi:hypothetical protein
MVDAWLSPWSQRYKRKTPHQNPLIGRWQSAKRGWPA